MFSFHRNTAEGKTTENEPASQLAAVPNTLQAELHTLKKSSKGGDSDSEDGEEGEIQHR